MNAPLSLTQLAAAWQQAKADEAAANARRVEIEQQICAAMPASDAESIEKRELDGVRIRVTYKVTRAVDSEKLQEMWTRLPEKARDCVRWKAELKLRELRAVQELLPDAYRSLANAIETKPAKPSVTVEEA